MEVDLVLALLPAGVALSSGALLVLFAREWPLWSNWGARLIGLALVTLWPRVMLLLEVGLGRLEGSALAPALVATVLGAFLAPAVTFANAERGSSNALE